MKSIVILAAQNIRVDTHDVVAGDVLAELRSDHPLLTLTQMVQMGQATIKAAAAQADLPQVIMSPGTVTQMPAGWDVQQRDPAPPVPQDAEQPSGSPLPASGRGAGGEGSTASPVGAPEPETADASIVLGRPLTDFPELDPKLREYLAAATPPITTLREATDYLAGNGGHFRKLANIGTAGDKQIKAALGL